ncbi:unnamed protein product [Sphagnum troendelagicum]|uniref:DNA polymerase delta subunit 4 n=1 Tax=Sphagnum troendelagicum TaxID=128251 RepID=A0ABP0U6D8_9BRYO
MATVRTVDSVFPKRKKANSASAAVDKSRCSLVLEKSKEAQDDDDVEEILRQFDMNLAYGPCLGLSRLARWERARGIGLNPSQHVKDVLELCAGGDSECLWEGRV